MENMNKRLDDLELRLKKLELEIQVLRNEQNIELDKNISRIDDKASNEVGVQHTFDSDISIKKEVEKSQMSEKDSYEHSTKEKKIKEKPVSKKSDNSESLVGKYLIGASASLLIFIAAISLIAIVWNKISPEVKLSIIGITGLVLSILGFKMTLKKASHISSIILGTGIGLVYIACVSANLVFLLISHEISALLCLVWTLMILFSYKYTKLYFTLVIASIGSFINLCFDLSYANDSKDTMLIIIYTGLVSLMLLYMSSFLDKLRNTLSIFFVFLNFSLIFSIIFFVWNAHYTLELAIIIIALFLVSNWMYRLSNRENIKFLPLLFAIVSTRFLYYFIYVEILKIFDITSLQASVLFLVVILAQCIINNIFYSKIEHIMTMFYILPLYIATLSINFEIFDFGGMSAGIIILLLILRKKFFKKPIILSYSTLFVFIDLCISYAHSYTWTLIFILVNITLLFYILNEENNKNLICRNLAVSILLLSYTKIINIICNYNHLNIENKEIQYYITYLLCVITIITIFKIGYLKIKDEIKSKSDKNISIYFFSMLLYIIGMMLMLNVELVAIKFLMMITVLVITAFQTYLALLDYKNISNPIGIWLVAKYFIFSWVTLRSFFELPIESVSYSVVGLLLAIVTIYAGFKLNVRIIRQLGLGITMLMVAKFIFVDLYGENSITRVIAFAIGGVLCFIISIIYNRLSKQ